ncbi:Histone-lysine N-methyltransferase EZH2 [Tolypocladium paradoxum]|uniref:Histone-lysine N-methyltransferase EZH2 n=1 Tax=Tolypocladium paradoxum TaxID=94208 RepID=A0A2S4KRF7_9HYPO|nr:Histone-lysine N-methyltransferase EZH2 [Tolypocladium paradoxum]
MATTAQSSASACACACACASLNRDNINGDHVSEREHSEYEPFSLVSRLEAFGSRRATGHSAASRGPISPPPFRRPSGVSNEGDPPVYSSRASPESDMVDRVSERSHLSRTGVEADMFRPGTPTPTSAAQCHWGRRVVSDGTPTGQADSDIEWTVPEIADQLVQFRQDVRDGHSQLTAYILESTKATERRVHNGTDLFAGINIGSVPDIKGTTMRVKFKQHLRAKKDQKEAHYNAVRTKTNKERVPRYRFHHVGIKKNVLTPNTMLTFVPHLRDLESSEETKYNLWLKELEDIDLKSGFKPLNREDKQALTYQLERAATVSLYLDTWLDSLAIPGCNKSALISYMASREPDDAITPQQKTNILRSHRETDNAAPGAKKAAQTFTDAFQHVFKETQPVDKQIDLRKVLLLDESVDSIMDSKPMAKDGAGAQNDEDDENDEDENVDEDELAESNLLTYCILGCLICFSHSCDHGEYDNKNLKRTFSISSCSHLSDALKQRRQGAANVNTEYHGICKRRCHLHCLAPFRPDPPIRDWSKDEEIVLRSIFVTATQSAFRSDPICLAANFLNRECSETYDKFVSLGVVLPKPEPAEPIRGRNLSWYDRRRKVLIGDWQDHTVSHEHQRRETLEPCSHPGPCLPRICPCVDAGLLCEKFCGCSVENCAYKFTGCACHAQGKTCQQKQKDKPCICVQLNRECDPQLCGSCGALERADPTRADDTRLHATGCQNCDLQRGVGKTLLLGQSQLDGVGYGLFTAEDITQDDFVIEYVGELITHDEGVRREARRGDVFDEDSNISYVFTLLENEGIWVDAAIYGNLSRYINHASENDKRGCNVTPRILYVNGEYRIKFTAMRDIQAGEELFFNYGENFPNLTKKLLDDKAGRQPGATKAKGARSRAETGDQVARKAPKAEKKRGPGRPRTKRDVAEYDLQELDLPEVTTKSRKRKRHSQNDSSEEEYHPPAFGEASHAAADSGADSEDRSRGSMTRLRKRLSRTQQAETPTKRGEQPKKTRGKRGGARPGSGRPRKHPRPVPKPAQAEAETDKASALPAVLATPQENRDSPRPEARAEVMMEIEDSDDAARGGFNEASVTDPGPAEAMLQEDEDDDQDVVVRKRNDRAARNRRPPAKFRDDDIWS